MKLLDVNIVEIESRFIQLYHQSLTLSWSKYSKMKFLIQTFSSGQWPSVDCYPWVSGIILAFA